MSMFYFGLRASFVKLYILVSLQVSQRGIQERTMKLTIYDVDRHKRHNVIGHALYPLKDHEYESNERVVIWRDLEKEVVEVNFNLIFPFK